MTINRTLNSLIERWAEDLLEDDACVFDTFWAPGTTSVTPFHTVAAAADHSKPLIFWPRDLILDGKLFEDIEHPTCHVFAATRAAANTIRLACQSECDRVIHRVMALNPAFVGGPLTVGKIPVAISSLHARRPHTRYRAPA